MPTSVLGFLVLCLAVVASAGCAVTRTLDTSALPGPSTVAMVEQWPVAVGVYIPLDVRTRVLTQKVESGLLEGQRWNVPVGQEAALAFRWALEQMFARVVVLDEVPSPTVDAEGVVGVFELSDIRLGSAPGLFHALMLDVALYSGSGEKIDSWQVASPETAAGPQLAHVIRDAIAQFMVGSADRPEVKAWLAGAGVAVTPARPVYRGGGGERPSRTRMLLSPSVSRGEAKNALKCLRERLARAKPPVDLVSAADVRMAFFPWLEPSLALAAAEDVQRWLAEPAIRQKMDALGIRYVLEFHGGTKMETPGGGVLFGAGFGAGGFFGYAYGTRESSFAVSILDVEQAAKPRDASVTERGSVHIPAFILPVPFIAATEKKACDELAGRIHEMLGKDAHAE